MASTATRAGYRELAHRTVANGERFGQPRNESNSVTFGSKTRLLLCEDALATTRRDHCGGCSHSGCRFGHCLCRVVSPEGAESCVTPDSHRLPGREPVVRSQQSVWRPHESEPVRHGDAVRIGLPLAVASVVWTEF